MAKRADLVAGHVQGRHDIMEQLRDGMVNRKTARSELKNAGYEIFIGILSVLSIVNIVLLYAIDDSTSTTSCTP